MRICALLLFFLSQVSAACSDSLAGLGMDSGYEVKQQIVDDLDGDGVGDRLSYLRNLKKSTIVFSIFFMESDGKCKSTLATSEIEFDGCGGSCGVEKLYAKNKSIFLQYNEKNGSYVLATTYQFKDRKGEWMLIGRKDIKYFLSVDDGLEEQAIDTNWITGDRNIIEKLMGGKASKKSEKVMVKPVLFRDFELSPE